MNPTIQLIILLTVTVVLFYLSAKFMSSSITKRFREKPDLLPETDDEFNKIENPVVKNNLKRAYKEYMDSDKEREDFKKFSKQVDDILEDNELNDIDSTKIKAHLIEDHYGNIDV